MIQPLTWIQHVFLNTITMDDINSHDDANWIEHIIFVRDVIPYEEDQYSISTLDGNEAKGFRKDRHVKRIQGLKSPEDKRYAYVTPEIKVCSLEMLTYWIPFCKYFFSNTPIFYKLLKVKGRKSQNISFVSSNDRCSICLFVFLDSITVSTSKWT